MDQKTHNVSGDSEAMPSFFCPSKFSVRDYITYDISTGQTLAINWLKIYPSRASCYLYNTFSAYKSLIVTPRVCDFFLSEVIKITQHMGIYFCGAVFSVRRLNLEINQSDCWNYLDYIFIHSCTYTTFQIKTVFKNVLFSTEVQNPLHVHLFAQSYIYIYTYTHNFVLKNEHAGGYALKLKIKHCSQPFLFEMPCCVCAWMNDYIVQFQPPNCGHFQDTVLTR